MWELHFFGFEFYYIFYQFFIYAIMGWIYESIIMSIKYKKPTNRGFLNGPIIPIYGVGGTLVYLVLTPVKAHPALVYICGMILATCIEYLVATILEHWFHSKWWDYSEYKLSYKGRIWLVATLFWGVLSLCMMYWWQPIAIRAIDRMPRKFGEYFGIFLFIIFMADLLSTLVTLIELDQAVAKLNKMRDSVMEYMESHKVTDLNDSFREWFRNSRYSEWQNHWKEKLNDIKQIQELKEYSKRMEGQYSVRMEAGQKFIVRRLLRAFPKVKFMSGQAVLEDLKERLIVRKKDQIQDAIEKLEDADYEEKVMEDTEK